QGTVARRARGRSGRRPGGAAQRRVRPARGTRPARHGLARSGVGGPPGDRDGGGDGTGRTGLRAAGRGRPGGTLGGGRTGGPGGACRAVGLTAGRCARESGPESINRQGVVAVTPRMSCAFNTSLGSHEHAAIAERLGYRRAWFYDSPALYADVWVQL